MFDFAFCWSEKDTQVFLPVFFTLIFFVCYWFTAHSKKIKDRFFLKTTKDQGSINHVFFTKCFGFLIMGVVPVFLCLLFLPQFSLADYGFCFISETALFSVFSIFLLSLILVPLAYFSAKKEKNLENYPQIRARFWTKKTLLISLAGWFLYLFGYEFLFRGVLLVPLVEPLGVWPAIAINVSLYSATHIPKGLDETLGAIPLGVLLCLLTIASQTIWIAFFVHVALAWTNNLVALKHNKNITLNK